MTIPDYTFGSPDERRSTVYLQHVAGFEVSDVSGGITFVTVDDMEKDADMPPTTLRQILRGEHGEVSALSGEFLLRNLVIPNLPVGLYGDVEEDPVILGVNVDIRQIDHDASTLEYMKARCNTASIEVVPTLGRLSAVSCFRYPRLGGHGIDWIVMDRAGCSFSMFGGLIAAHIMYDQLVPDVLPNDLIV